MTDDVNPFRFGALALDDAFTDRKDEIAELKADVRNGQDVVIFAPRRYGKTSLVWRASQELVREKVLVASVDLMTTPTPAKLAEKLARAIHDDVATPLLRAKERLKIFSDLRVRPTITVEPETGNVAFRFAVTERGEDLHATIERLLELPGELAADRGRTVALVLDEFQEVADIDPKLPRLMRAVFQAQPEVAHVYLGSKRHMMRRIFSDANEPFWRSAKQVELGVIDPKHFRGYIRRRFDRTGRVIAPDGLDAIIEVDRRAPLRDPGAVLLRLAGDAARGALRRRARGGGAGEGAALRARALLAAVGARLVACSGCCWPSWRASPGGRCRPTTAAATTSRAPRPSSARSRRSSATRSSCATAASSGSPSRSWPRGCGGPRRDIRPRRERADASPGRTASGRSASAAGPRPRRSACSAAPATRC